MDIENISCNYCNVKLIEEYKMYDCHLCEDWGGCKKLDGYYYLKCPKCRRDYEKTKIIEWNSSGRLKDYF